MTQNRVFKNFFTSRKEKKHKAIEEFLLNKKNFDEKILKEVKNNGNLIDRYLESVKKVEDLTEKMNNKKETFDFSFRTIFKRSNAVNKEIIHPEFLMPSLFKAESFDNQPFNLNSSSIKNFGFSISGNNNINNDFKTDIIEDEEFIKDPFDKNLSEYELKEKFDYPLESTLETVDKKKTSVKSKQACWLSTGIPGFDELLEKGIPVGSNIIISGGPGTGKTIFCLQVIYNKALEGKDCVFLSMEERPDRLKEHMLEFGFKVKEIKRSSEEIILSVDGKGKIALKRLQPVRLARSIEALLEKASGTLPVDLNLILDFIPKDFDAYLLVLDSISAIETAFSGTKRQYRIQIEQLFRYFEDMNITTFMITESSDAPHKFSSTGVEEFLSDGIFVFYNFQGGKKRTRGIEIFKLRGASHSQKIVSMNITSKGVEIFPDIYCL